MHLNELSERSPVRIFEQSIHGGLGVGRPLPFEVVGAFWAYSLGWITRQVPSDGLSDGQAEPRRGV